MRSRALFFVVVLAACKEHWSEAVAGDEACDEKTRATLAAQFHVAGELRCTVSEKERELCIE
jgi:hypothetical protein